jgi:hypothetical protein
MCMSVFSSAQCLLSQDESIQDLLEALRGKHKAVTAALAKTGEPGQQQQQQQGSLAF